MFRSRGNLHRVILFHFYAVFFAVPVEWLKEPGGDLCVSYDFAIDVHTKTDTLELLAASRFDLPAKNKKIKIERISAKDEKIKTNFIFNELIIIIFTRTILLIKVNDVTLLLTILIFNLKKKWTTKIVSFLFASGLIF
jgi:hypothetical protein